MEYADLTQPTSEILSALSMKSEEVDEAPPTQTEPQAPPPSEYDSLTAQLAENPHNPDGWRSLIRVAEDTGDIEKIGAAYDALLKQYPNNVRLLCSSVRGSGGLTPLHYPGDSADTVYNALCEFRVDL